MIAPPRRRLLSDIGAREIQWAFKRFDSIETSLKETVMALDGTAADGSDAVADLFPPALEVLETALPDHPALGTILLGYGQLLSTRDPAQAKGILPRALEMTMKSQQSTRGYVLLRELAGAPALKWARFSS